LTGNGLAATEPWIDSAIAVVPARGGSKAIPGENLAVVGDRSLLQRAIEACRGAESVALCMVTTDDLAIGATAEKLGAAVVWRPEILASDTATSESAVMHALEEIESRHTTLPSLAIMVQCTSPFVRSDDLDSVARVLVMEGADSCFTAAPSHRFLWRIDDEGLAVAINHDARRRLPRQELGREFVETGAVYGFRIDGFRQHLSRFFGRVMIAETDESRSMEIDDPFDLTLARALTGQLET
jgi:CMP-N-acetylneuraminic acid synthetase